MANEGSSAEDEYPLEKSMKYLALLKKAEDQGDTEGAKNARRELNLLNPIVGGPHIWRWWTDNLNVPFPTWSKEDAPYYRKRYSETTNALDKARYAYAVWTLDRHIEFAKNATASFLRAGELYYAESWYKDGIKFKVMASCFVLAARLSLSLNLQSPLDIVSILTALERIVGEMDSKNEKGREISDLVEVSATIAQDIYDNQRIRTETEIQRIFSTVLSIALKLAAERHAKKEFHWYRSHLEACVQLTKVTQGQEKPIELRKRIADSYIEEAGTSSSNLVKLSCCQNALKLYSELGLSQQIETTKKLIAEFSEKAVHEFKEISVPVKIPTQKIVEEYVGNNLIGRQPQRILDILPHDASLIPEKKEVIKTIEGIKREHPLSFIFPIMLFDRDSRKKKITDENEIFEHKVNQQYVLESQIRGGILTEILKAAFEVFATESDLIEFLRRSKNITANSMQILESGVAHHFRHEYIASIHVLMPQVEEIIRTLVINHGATPTKYEPSDEGVQEKLLGGLLVEADEFLGEDFAEYLKIRLTPDGENIRNKVCHGWMEIRSLNEELSTVLIHMILKLSVL